MAQDSLPPARGGNGGNAQVDGNGLAIGGAGGRIAGNAKGVRGGDGGGGALLAMERSWAAGTETWPGLEFGCHLHG
jgi:hypothetical protein